MAASSRGLSEADAVQVAKEFYDSKGPFAGTFRMATPVLGAYRNRARGLFAEWSLRYTVEPDTGDDYFVRFFFQRPWGPSGPGEWQVRNMHQCDQHCIAGCPSAPSESGPGARIDLHEYRMTVQGMKVDQLRSELAGKGLNSNGKKEALIKRLIDAAEAQEAAADAADAAEAAEAAQAAAGTTAMQLGGQQLAGQKKRAAPAAGETEAKRPKGGACRLSESDESDDELLFGSHPFKTSDELAADAQARADKQARREGTVKTGPSFEDEVKKIETKKAKTSKKKGGAAAAGASEDSAIDLSTEGAQIVRALFEIERAAAQAIIPERPTPLAFKASFSLMQHQKQALAWMQQRESTKVPFSGGILADEMGLGKTAECLSVIVADIQDNKHNATRVGPTLVCCPTSVVDSWETELYSRFDTAFRPRTTMWYGAGKSSSVEELQSSDIVLTTFGCLLPGRGMQLKDFDSDGEAYKALKKIEHPLFAVKWRRVILDEAHYIRNHKSESARACRLLHAERRWAVSGTPIQNSVDDLLSIFMFLQYRPVDTPKEFHANFGGNKRRDWAFEGGSGDIKQVPVNVKKLQLFLGPIILRRRKDTKRSDGKLIVQLPKKTISVTESTFSEDEQEFYTQLEVRMAKRFKQYADKGVVLENYTNILVMINKLRQACNHPHLATRGKVAQPGYRGEGESLLESLDKAGILKVPEPIPGQTGEVPPAIEANLERLKPKLTGSFEETCSICIDVIDPGAGIVTLCSHMFCSDCLSEWRDQGNMPCPECRQPITDDPLTPLNSVLARIRARWPPPVIKDEKKVKAEKAAAAAAAAEEAEEEEPVRRTWMPSAKLTEMSGLLKKMQAEDSAMKCIVFSNFTTFLDMAMIQLKKTGFRAVRVDGSMGLEARQKQLHIFRTDARCSVLVMSLKTGSHGLNLTCASNVILCEPWWNPMPEQQAMDRVHRTGQTKPVTVSAPSRRRLLYSQPSFNAAR